MAYEYHEYIDENGDIIEHSIYIEEKDELNPFVFKGDTVNLLTYKNIAKAIAKSGGNRSNLVGIIAAYKEITGSEINKSTLEESFVD